MFAIALVLKKYIFRTEHLKNEHFLRIEQLLVLLLLFLLKFLFLVVVSGRARGAVREHPVM